jgi:hypothetical protein
LSLIIDDNEEDIQRVILSDDGTGAGIRIPALLMTKKDGQKLRDWMLKATKEELDQIQLQADFLIERKQEGDSQEVELWYTSSDDASLDFLRNIARYFEGLMRVIDFEPKFVTHSCRRCAKSYRDTQCVSDGRYCAMRHAYNLDITGKEIVMEDLRQYCIYWLSDSSEASTKYTEFMKKSPRTMYLEYMIRIHQIF